LPIARSYAAKSNKASVRRGQVEYGRQDSIEAFQLLPIESSNRAVNEPIPAYALYLLDDDLAVMV